MFKELNDGKLPEELFKSSFQEEAMVVMNLNFMRCIGMLNGSNEHFIDYLLFDFAEEFLAENKKKIYLDTGNIYYDNLNMTERIYSFM